MKYEQYVSLGYINVIDGKYVGYRGYIRHILNGKVSPNECIVYKPGECKPSKVYLKDSEIEKI